MPTTHSYDYAVVRVAPQVERAEFINAGVILFCRSLRFLAARIALDEQRLLPHARHIDLEEVGRHLAAIPRICAGERSAGPIGALTQAERFHWLVAPRSTIIQTSPVHCGLSDDPEATLACLMVELVRVIA